MPYAKSSIRAAVLAMLFALPTLAADEAPVRMTVAAEVTGRTLQLRGEATVPDGAWIIYAARTAADPGTRATGYAEVRDGRYAATVDVAGWPAGEIAVDAHFQTMLPDRTQPEEIIARYGEHSERMTGPEVIRGGEDYRFAVASTTARKR